MDFEAHPAIHFVVILRPGPNMPYIVLGLVILQEAPNHRDKPIPLYFLGPSEVIREFLSVYDFLYLWSDEDTGFGFYCRQLMEEVLKVLEG